MRAGFTHGCSTRPCRFVIGAPGGSGDGKPEPGGSIPTYVLCRSRWSRPSDGWFAVSQIEGRLGSAVPEDERPVVLPDAFEQARGIEPDEDVARWLRRHYASAVTIVTSFSDEGLFGVTVSAFAYISLEPLLVLVALGNDSQTGERIVASGSFGVSLLTNRHRFVADRFAGRAPLVDRRFSDVPHLMARTGSPLLADAIAWLDCRLESAQPGGDHTIYVGRALAVGHGTGDEEDPLLYFNSRYARLS